MITAMFAQVGVPVDAPLVLPEVAWSALAPLLILIVGALGVLVITALSPRSLPVGFFTITTVAIASGAAVVAVSAWDRVTDPTRGPYTAIAGAVTVDGFSVLVTALLGAIVVLVALLADGHLRREGLSAAEFSVLVLLSASGGVMMALANDLIVMFLGLEVLSIALYVLAGYQVNSVKSQESAMKYFLLGAFASAFLLYGIALVYGGTGTTNLGEIGGFLSRNVPGERGLMLGGMVMLIVGLGFKVGVVPFQSWVPDVYQGAPTPVTAFMASGVKVAGFAALLRVIVSAFEVQAQDWRPVMWVLAILTLLVGPAMAIVQSDVKRMLAYSSVSHAGFILIGVQAASDQGTAGSLFYLFAYSFMALGAFGVVSLIVRQGETGADIGQFRGLSKRRPVLALAFAIFLLAQTGVPLTSGFMAKFSVIGAAVSSESYALAMVAMFTSVVGAFAYLRVVMAMYVGSTDENTVDAQLTRVQIPASAGLALGLALLVTIGIGILPSAALDAARDAVPVLISPTR
ncbi:MAG: NADH-quinone oxidoreductase subunit N [Acidimicrobiales bacterium]